MSVCEFVTLRGGTVVPVEVVRLALALEARGLHWAADGDSIVVGPRGLLTDADRDQIRRWKRHLIALAEYDAAAFGAVH